MYSKAKSLSLNESEKIANQADFLCEVIKSHSQSLREARLGGRVDLNGVSFRLFQKDRNTIYQVQFAELPTSKEEYAKKGLQKPGVLKMKRLIRHSSPKKEMSFWFLKMPRLRNTQMIKREILGAEVVKKALESHTGYYHMSAIRASVNHAYVLYSKIPGKQLHRALYRACLMPAHKVLRIQGSDVSTMLSQTFSHFGSAIALCHNYNVGEDSSLENLNFQVAGLKGEEKNSSRVCIPLASRHPAVSLGKALDKITVSDTISRSIAQWLGRQDEKKIDNGIVHGNLRLDNVLVSGNKICIIDFENCGYGPIYTDLAWTCSLILLIRTLPLFPWKRAQFALNAFLDGYKSVSVYDHEILHQFVTMLLCYHYVEAFCLGNMKARWLACLPVSKSRFQHLLMAMLKGKIDPISDTVNL